LITKAPPIDFKTAVPGIDRELAAILHRCLAINPKHRYASVQALLYDLESRASRRARRPLLLMGLVGPIVLLLIAALFAVDWMDAIMDESREELVRRALEGNRFAARLAAGQVEEDLARRFDLVEQAAQEGELKELMDRVAQSEDWQPKLEDLATRSSDDPALHRLQRDYQQAATQRSNTPPGALEAWLLKLGESPKKTQAGREMPIASWLICDRRGVCLGRWPPVKQSR
jgi:hypothetical protein